MDPYKVTGTRLKQLAYHMNIEIRICGPDHSPWINVPFVAAKQDMYLMVPKTLLTGEADPDKVTGTRFNQSQYLLKLRTRI